MALPELSVFEEFLAGARVVDEQPALGLSELIQTSTPSVHGPGVTLWLECPPGGLQLDSVLKKIGEALATAGAPSSRSVTLAVLALILETKGTERHVEHANRLLGELRQGNLLFAFVTSDTTTPSTEIRADYGPVRVEPFNPTKLAYWAERGRARWPFSLEELRGRVAFVGEIQGVTLIDTDGLPGAQQLWRRGADAAKGLVDAYFQAVADALLDQLATDVSQRLSLVEAAGIVGFDFSSLQS